MTYGATAAPVPVFRPLHRGGHLLRGRRHGTEPGLAFVARCSGGGAG